MDGHENSSPAFENALSWISHTRINIFDEFKNVSIETLPFSSRLKNVLQTSYISSLGDLNGLSLEGIARRGIKGERTIAELRETIERCGYGDPCERVEVSPVIAKILRDWNFLMNSGEITVNRAKESDPTIRIPEAFKRLPVNAPPFSFKLSHILRSLGVSLLGDLERISMDDVGRTFNCGVRTLIELKSFIIALEKSGAVANRSPNNCFSPETPASKKSNEPRNMGEMILFINRFIDKLGARDKKFLLDGFGGGREAKNAAREETGENHPITKAQAGRLQAKIIRDLRLSLSAKSFLEKLRARCIADVYPLTPKMLLFLTQEDINVLKFPPSFYLNLLGELSHGLPVLPEPGCGLSEESDDDDSSQTIYDIKMFLKSHSAPVALGKVLIGIGSQAESKRFLDKKFLKAVGCGGFIIAESNDPRVVTLELKKKRLQAKLLVRKILELSDSPLTPEEIVERCVLLYGDEHKMMSPRTVMKTLLQKCGFYLLDRRRIGLRRHFRLPPQRWDELKSDFLNSLVEKNRSVSTREVVNEGKFAWTALTTAAETAQILREDSRFSYLGRFHFALASKQINRRIYSSELIVEILRAAAHPMSYMDIVREIQKARPVFASNVSGLINKVDAVEGYGHGFYGLKEWNETSVRGFLAANETFVNRLILETKSPPLTFGELCRLIGITGSGVQADELWAVVKSLPATTLRSGSGGRETAFIEILETGGNNARSRKLFELRKLKTASKSKNEKCETEKTH